MGGLGVAAAALWPRVAFAATSSAPVPLATTSTALVTFSEDFASRYTNAVPASISVNATTAMGGAQVRIAFDRTSIEWTGDHAIGSTGHRIFAADVVESDAGIEFTIPEGVRSSSIAASLPLRTKVAFPAENVGPLSPATVTVATGNEELATPFSIEGDTSTGAAWGGSVDVAWATRDVTGGDEYFVPNTVVLTSVGPAAIPAGSVVEIVTDAVLSGSASLDSAGPSADAEAPPAEPDPAAASPWLDESVATGQGARSTRITIQGDIAAGTTLTLQIENGERTVRASAKSITYAQVSLIAPEPARAMQRLTGAETITALAPGGLPLSTGAFTGSV